MKYEKCMNCEQPFSKMNTRTVDGWLETQISGLCENCFDELCAEAGEESGYDGPEPAPF